MAEKLVTVELLNDVWIADESGNVVRVTTNTPVLDEQGRVKVDPKTLAPVTIIEKRALPASVAKMLVEQGKARVPFVMPE